MIHVVFKKEDWKLDTFGPAFERALGKVNVQTAYDVERAAKRLTPVDTGTLRTDYDVRVTGLGETVDVVHGSGPASDYAAPVHNGRRTASGSTVAGTFHLTKAVDNNKANYTRRVRAAYNQAAR